MRSAFMPSTLWQHGGHSLLQFRGGTCPVNQSACNVVTAKRRDGSFPSVSRKSHSEIINLALTVLNTDSDKF